MGNRMRVNERAERRPATSAEAGRFAEALRRARIAATARTAACGPAARERPIEARKAAFRGAAAEVARREAARDEERALAGAAPDAPRDLRADPPPVPEIAALVRALPAAVDAARVRDGAPLALSFGRSLDVELRSSGAGVEVVLRPEPRLLRAAEAELPRVVEALRLRGVEVARAEVRPRGGGRRPR